MRNPRLPQTAPDSDVVINNNRAVVQGLMGMLFNSMTPEPGSILYLDESGWSQVGQLPPALAPPTDYSNLLLNNQGQIIVNNQGQIITLF